MDSMASITVGKLDTLTASLRDSKAFIEETLSRKFNDRPVNIIGQINSII